jgi:chromosome partitioning protein
MSEFSSATRGAIKLKLALDFCRFSGSADSFRSLFPAAHKGAGDKHNVYTPADIRRARVKLMGADETMVRPQTLPPVIYARMTRGGVGKTTISSNVAATMACMGYKVLLVDADPQATLTSLFGVDWANEDIVHIGNLLVANESGAAIDWTAAVRSIYDGMLHLIASDISLANVEPWLSSISNKEGAVARLFEDHLTFFCQYDVIVIDSAPGTTQLSNSLMYAARRVLAVVRPDGSTLKAMEVLTHNVKELNRAFRDLKITVRIVANAFDSRISTCRVSLDTLREAYQGLMDPNVIPAYASFVRQVDLFDDARSGPILEREPNSPGAKAIIDLTRSLIGYYEVRLAGMVPIVPDSPRRRSGMRASA